MDTAPAHATARHRAWLSLLFQLVYTWRTFFILYSEDDYVELGVCEGARK